MEPAVQMHVRVIHMHRTQAKEVELSSELIVITCVRPKGGSSHKTRWQLTQTLLHLLGSRTPGTTLRTGCTRTSTLAADPERVGPRPTR